MYLVAITVEVSTSPPSTEREPGAIDFSLWKFIGREVMVKSNINNWLRCSEAGKVCVCLSVSPLHT